MTQAPKNIFGTSWLVLDCAKKVGHHCRHSVLILTHRNILRLNLQQNPSIVEAMEGLAANRHTYMISLDTTLMLRCNRKRAIETGVFHSAKLQF